jgi:hypothetical protein
MTKLDKFMRRLNNNKYLNNIIKISFNNKIYKNNSQK